MTAEPGASVRKQISIARSPSMALIFEALV